MSNVNPKMFDIVLDVWSHNDATNLQEQSAELHDTVAIFLRLAIT